MPEQRNDSIDRIRRDGAFDVIVVGGGINGIGVYRELALQGLRVLIVERNDFCSGCSAAPSRMIHGGLRYLENGEFGLVRESLRERDALLANAPHMVRPLPTTIPIRSVFSGLMNGAAGFLGLSAAPASRGAVAVKIGLSLYDWTTRHRRRLPRHAFLGARRTHEEWPGLDPALKFSATYHDAWISFPERLGVELLLDTARLAPVSVALNYAEIVRIGDGFAVVEKLSGETLAVTARAVVNATGAWVDEAAKMLGARDAAEPFVSGTKGSHLILDSEALRLALKDHMVFFENDDGRVCIVFPYLGRVLAGSTDIRVGQPGRVRCEPEERDYIIDALQRVFPGIAVSVGDVVYSYSGIRPLPRSDQEFTGRISRGHFVQRIDGAVPQFCMIGGKWTTFRAFAEQAADEVLAELGHARVEDTIAMAIGGGAGFPDDAASLADELTQTFDIDARRAAHLVAAYGTRARDVLAFCQKRDDDLRLDDATEVTAAEIVFLIRHEFVVRLPDLLLRRTALSIRGDISMELVERVADILADELGTPRAQARLDAKAFAEELERYHGVSRETLDQRTRDRSVACA